MIAVKTTKFFVRALTVKGFSHNTYFCSLGVLQIILNFVYLNARRQRKLNFNSVAVSHMEKSPPHPECLCADQLTGTRMTPLRVFAAPNKTQQYFLTVYTLEPPGDRNSAIGICSPWGFHRTLGPCHNSVLAL